MLVFFKKKALFCSSFSLKINTFCTPLPFQVPMNKEKNDIVSANRKFFLIKKFIIQMLYQFVFL